MDALVRLIDSYLNSRAALLRGLEDHSPSTTGLLKSVLTSGVIFKRRRDPVSWRPDELLKLAEELRMSASAITGLRLLAPQLLVFPDSVLRPLLKTTNLDRHKLSLRSQDVNGWLYVELIKLTAALRRWPAHGSQQDMASALTAETPLVRVHTL